MIRMALASDFRDYYDFAFYPPERAAVVFTRHALTTVRRRDDFAALVSMGYTTPKHGLVRSLAADGPEGAIVVYTNERAHRGDGKELCSPRLARAHYADLYGSRFVGEYPPVVPPKSYRELWVGDRRFMLVYASDDVWRSNVGSDVAVQYLEELRPPEPSAATQRHPDQALYAVDLVRHNGVSYAVDFNTAPGLAGSGIEAVLPPQQAHDALARFIYDARQKPLTA